MRKFSIKYKTLIFIALIFINIGLLFDYKIVSRLAVSNIFQVIAMCILLPVILKNFRLKEYINILFFIAGFLAAILSIHHFYNIGAKIPYFLFFFLAYVQLLFIYVVVKKEKSKSYLEEFLKSYKIVILPILAYCIGYAIYGFIILKEQYMTFGFDDKSHAVILLMFYAFFSLKLIKSNFKFLISIIFCVLALTTISRLAFIFLPFYLLALFPQIFKNINNFLQLYIRLLIVVLLVGGATYYIVNNPQYFQVLNRINNTGVTADSTSSHMLLIQYGLKLKFENICNFIFGITPGGFSNVLINSKIDVSEFAYLDPTAYLVMLKGNAPMHSTHIQILAEFPIWVFITYIILLATILKKLISKRMWLETMFFVAFLIAITFYSTHNELLFYSILTYLMFISYLSKSKKAKKHKLKIIY